MLVSDELVARTKAAIAALTEQKVIASTVDLTTCDQEAIHIPQSIQPHGWMVVFSSDWQVQQISENVKLYLGKTPQVLLGQSAEALLGKAQWETVQKCLKANFEVVNPMQLSVATSKATNTNQASDEFPATAPRLFTAVVHRSEDLIVLELEPLESEGRSIHQNATTDSAEDHALEGTGESSNLNKIGFFDFYRLVKLPVSRFQQAKTLRALCQSAVEEIRSVTGFDRVMVYQFDEDDSGSVIAEAVDDQQTPYLGLHYPPTDIPKQAKHLYMLNLLRLIPDVVYEPVPLVSASANGLPVDMSLSGLRSVSPLHVEYLTHMGVRASMSISLVVDGKLWGLVACHHNQPRKISYELRTVCEFLGQAIALEIGEKERNENQDYKLKLKNLQASFVSSLPHAIDLKSGLTENSQRLLDLTGASGVAYCDKGDITLIGQTPEKDEVSALVDWLSEKFSQSATYHTASLSQEYCPAATFPNRISGLLALSISHVQQLYVIWFRPEVIQTVNWAGNPDKPVEIDEDGQARLSPRKSFERWQQQLEGQSLAWLPCEVEAALELRSAVIGLVLQRADELAAINVELERSNAELDSFAYIASHDLKEPLRGIHNYSSFLIEDYSETLGDDGTEKLQTLMRLTQRMEDLISSLLHYSRLGRADLRLHLVDLNKLVDGVIELLKVSQSEAVDIVVPETLPQTKCDRTQITELFTNLVTNAIKYNDKPSKRVEIGFIPGSEALAQSIFPDAMQSALRETASVPTVFYVKDNGIGIRSHHIEAVFRIFKRLHAQSRYGGGTGAGLTIAKKIVERHGGSIWVESVFREGSCFYFTLSGSEPQQSGESDEEVANMLESEQLE